MQNLTLELISEFISKNDIPLKSTHERLCLPIINRIYRKMLMEIKFPIIKVDEDLIIDGHHRYLAALIANKSLDIIPSFRSSATEITKWKDIKLDISDWDTEAKILLLNKQDAKYNSIELDEIIEFLK